MVRRTCAASNKIDDNLKSFRQSLYGVYNYEILALIILLLGSDFGRGAISGETRRGRFRGRRLQEEVSHKT